MDNQTETPLTLEHALDLLGLQSVPGGTENSGLLLSGLEPLVKRYGEDWVRQNKRRLVEEFEILIEL